MTALHWSLDGHTLTSISGDNLVMRINVETGDLIESRKGRQLFARPMRWSEPRDLLAAPSRSTGSITLWQPTTGLEKMTLTFVDESDGFHIVGTPIPNRTRQYAVSDKASHIRVITNT